jgi:hypothetical protein
MHPQIGEPPEADAKRSIPAELSNKEKARPGDAGLLRGEGVVFRAQ